jgi:23S rRNA pseudouridine2605 synthase
VPLARALSKLGFASRQDARALIRDGRVRVDGRVVIDPMRPVVPERIAVAIDGVARARDARRILVFHKPRGVLTTRRDPAGRPTIFDVLGEAGAGLNAVGRLDRASTGLLILTNDTRLAHALTDPDRAVPRRYVVTVRGRVPPGTAAAMAAGVDVRDAAGRVERLTAAVTIRKASSRETHLLVDLTEGRNREIRRLFEAAGHEVTRLHRVAFGPFALGDLAPGAWRAARASEELAAELPEPALRRPPLGTE